MTGASIAKVSTAPGVANLHIWLLCVRYELYKVELHESHLFWLSCVKVALCCVSCCFNYPLPFVFLQCAPADIVEGAVIILQAAPLPLGTERVWPTLPQGCRCLVDNPRIPPAYQGG